MPYPPTLLHHRRGRRPFLPGGPSSCRWQRRQPCWRLAYFWRNPTADARFQTLPGGRAHLLLRGEIQHKDLWLIDLETGAQRQLTNLTPDFDIRDFDISPDGREVVLERVQERSDVVLLDLPRP